ncbi:hypothetical protein F1D05_10940 [Kribbella qitaiheensis]|uniref:Uncharacterized protein n=1 Tax=Kribbella qitaiheensis TaxID=1544730 RepID=A0A7G6WWF0_9ACTN|nr:hypothetical protein [Kribbella qitaiheensis]QNE18315.1 hypothetical protein F1D05_10940 [Kribbella qitaiheensis]
MDDDLITAQMVRITPMLFEALAGADGDPMIAARFPDLRSTWSGTEQQTRAALLLSLAWHARTRESVAGDTTSQQYPGDLQKFAVDHTGDLESFHEDNYPARPLPGRAGERVTSYTEGRADLTLSLETALILFGTQSPAPNDLDEDDALPANRQHGVRTNAEQPHRLG